MVQSDDALPPTTTNRNSKRHREREDKNLIDSYNKPALVKTTTMGRKTGSKSPLRAASVKSMATIEIVFGVQATWN